MAVELQGRSFWDLYHHHLAGWVRQVQSKEDANHELEMDM